MDYCSDFRFDLKIAQLKEKELGELLDNASVEVKHDLKALETKNVFVEYSSRQKPSGISTSEADYYCFCFGKTFHFISTKELKCRCRKYIGTKRDVAGGDNNTSKGILLPLDDLF